MMLVSSNIIIIQLKKENIKAGRLGLPLSLHHASVLSSCYAMSSHRVLPSCRALSPCRCRCGSSKNLKTIIYVTVVSNIINNESEKKIPKPHHDRLGFPLSSLCIVDASCAAVVVVIT